MPELVWMKGRHEHLLESTKVLDDTKCVLGVLI